MMKLRILIASIPLILACGACSSPATKYTKTPSYNTEIPKAANPEMQADSQAVETPKDKEWWKQFTKPPPSPEPDKLETKDDVKKHTRVHEDFYRKTVSIEGPLVTNAMKRADDHHLLFEKGNRIPRTRFLLRALAVRGEGKPVKFTYQLYFKYKAPDWAFINDAYDIAGNHLELVEISQDVAGDGVYEDVAVCIDKEYLKERLGKGINIKLYGKNGLSIGDSLVMLPGYYLAGFMQAVEEWETSLHQKASH